MKYTRAEQDARWAEMSEDDRNFLEFVRENDEFWRKIDEQDKSFYRLLPLLAVGFVCLVFLKVMV